MRNHWTTTLSPQESDHHGNKPVPVPGTGLATSWGRHVWSQLRRKLLQTRRQKSNQKHQQVPEGEISTNQRTKQAPIVSSLRQGEGSGKLGKERRSRLWESKIIYRYGQKTPSLSHHVNRRNTRSNAGARQRISLGFPRFFVFPFAMAGGQLQLGIFLLGCEREFQLSSHLLKMLLEGESRYVRNCKLLFLL